MGETSERDIVTPSGIRIPESSLAWRFSRSGGPGGQHVNTADTRVELVCDLKALDGPDDALSRVRGRLGDRVRVVSSAERSQLRNREAALERLADRIEEAGRTIRPRRPTRPSRGAVEARLEHKRRHSRLKRSRRADEDGP